MDTYKITISNETKETIKKMQNLSSAIDTSAYTESIIKIGNMLSNFTKAMYDTLPDMKLMSETMQRSLNNIAQVMSSYNYMHELESMTQMVKELSKNLSNMQTEQLKSLSQIDFRQLYSHMDYHNKSFDNLVDLAYEATVAEVGVSPIAKEELKETLNDTKENTEKTKNIDTHIYDNVEKFKREHYRFYIIFSFFIVHIFLTWFDDTIGKHVIPKTVSIVKELPEKGSEIICHLEQNIEAIITENQNYYYKVSFIDENGIEREGYVAKRNLKIIDKENDSGEETSVSANDIDYDH